MSKLEIKADIKTVDLTNEALKLANMGFHVFPIDAYSRAAPKILAWQEQASTDPDKICEWWSHWGVDCNIGIHACGLIVVDLDVIRVRNDNGKVIASKPNDWEHIQRLLEENPPIVVTPSGGKHLFFRKPEGFECKLSASKVYPNVDIRSDRGYVVGPGSLAPDKVSEDLKPYRWVVEPDGGVAGIPMAPDWLIDILKAANNRSHVSKPSSGSSDSGLPHDSYLAPATIAPGTSDNELTALGGYLRRGGLSEEEIYATLCAANVARAGGRKPDDELRRIARSVSKYEPDQALEMAIMGFPTPEELADTGGQEIENPGSLPKSLLAVPGLIGEIIQYNLSTAIRQQPELALSGAIALMAAITSGKIAEESGMRPNIYILGIGRTGSGKDYARKVNKAIVEAANWEDLLDGEGFGSGPGLIDALTEKRCSLFQIDEFGEMLAMVANNKAPAYHKSIIALMLTLYTSSDSTYKKPVLKKPPKTTPKSGAPLIVDDGTIREPHLNVYGTSVIESVLESLTPQAVSNGLLARFITMEGEPIDPYPRRVPKVAVPASLVAQVEYWRDFNPGGNLASTGQATFGTAIAKPMVVPYDQSGLVAMDQFVAVVEAEKNKREQAWELYTRVIEKTIKLALLFACSRDAINPVMDSQAVEWAFGVVMHGTQRLRFLASSHLAASAHEADCLKAKTKIRELVAKSLQEGGDGSVRERDVNRALRSFGSRREEIKKALILDYGATVTEQKTGGNTGRMWTVR